MSTSSICVGAPRTAKTFAQNTGTWSAHSWERYSCVSAFGESSGALVVPGNQQNEVQLEGASYPAQREGQEGFSVGYASKETETWDLSLTAILFFLCAGTIQAGDWNAFCNFLLGKTRAAALQGACILQQQMKMGCSRRMLHFFLMRIAEILP